MRIAFINDSLLTGRGTDHVVFELAQRLGKKHDVTVITSIADLPEKNFKIILVKGRRLVTGNWRDFLGFFQIFKYRKFADKFDVINLHHATLAFAFLGKKNVVVTYNGNPPTTGEKKFRKFFRNLSNAINRLLLRFNERTIVISEYAKKELIKSKVPADKIEVIYYGVNNEFKKTAKRKDKEYMLFVGRQEPHKRIDEIIRISKDLNFKLKIAGSGTRTEKLKSFAKKINAPVEFLGRVSEKEKIKLYQECSFFISASKWEDFGLIFAEAAKCGKPSVAYSVGSIPEIIKDKETGLLAKNFKELIKCANILIKDRNLRNKLGLEAAKFSKNFSWEITCNKYEKSLKTLESKR
jgi:glycosyltransferase involved in cell wall biosynthesis